MTRFVNPVLFAMGLSVAAIAAGWAQESPSAPAPATSSAPSSLPATVPSSPSSSHAHERTCMAMKERSRTGPCPLKDPSNKAIPGVSGRASAPAPVPAKTPPPVAPQDRPDGP
ncbi:hypothetical protein [Gluconacetobacter takamatsuzukensis]|uniref:Uncharacterized protein n=1 Tax=Gluconacetobacter takamatsuzukensis TaxID=1286190 RepID=A0A7W4KEL9_9PROT|nr:hypothetical protein [Gluconacetobacter takamatsuzukensis]MBB2205521.1 hypothetical protein [Gluconacetobacter takamatsuzukensis]